MINDKNRSQKISTFKTDRNRTSIEIMQLSLAFRPFQVEIFQPVIQNCPKFTSKVTFDNDFSVILSEIRMSPAANRRGLCEPIRIAKNMEYLWDIQGLSVPSKKLWTSFFKKYLLNVYWKLVPRIRIKFLRIIFNVHYMITDNE